MAIGSGLSAQLGMVAETVYGTPVTVTRFYEFLSEGIKDDVGKVYGRGMGRGRFAMTDRVKTFLKGAGGPVSLEVTNKDFGLIFQHMLGQNTITGAGADKTHTCIPDALAQFGKMMSLQVGRPDIAGVVQPYSYEGGKIKSWELKCALDGPLMLDIDWDFQNVLTGTALAAASYTTTRELFVFTEGALTIGGSTIAVSSASIKGDNALATDRRFLGSQVAKKEPIAGGFVDITGTFNAEFESLARYAAWVAGTQAQLILTFTTTTLIPTTAVPYSLTITIPAIEYTGENPTVGSPDIVTQNLPFKALYNGTNSIITMVYVTTDTVP